jgi:hypothetical protein
MDVDRPTNLSPTTKFWRLKYDMNSGIGLEKPSEYSDMFMPQIDDYLTQEFCEWFDELLAGYVPVDEDEFEPWWSFEVLWNNSTWSNAPIGYKFVFADHSMALMMKLAWGGKFDQ